MAVVIKKSGMLTTIQDMGRYGSQKYGVCVSGAMDKRSARLANILAGNPENSPVLEATFLGPAIVFEEDCVIAITGGDLSPSSAGKPVPMYQAYQMHAGEMLMFGAPKTGCRAYIAFSGELDIETSFGSCSTHLRSGMGGLDGTKLKDGTRFTLKGKGLSGKDLQERYVKPDIFDKNELDIRVVLGPQYDSFTPNGIATFFSSPYTMTNECDRSGLRLTGEKVEHQIDGNIVSDAIACGSVQIPSNGLPIILMADCQTVGGYAKMAVVINADLHLLAQAKPGTVIHFKNISMEKAQDIYVSNEEQMNELNRRLNPVPSGGSESSSILNKLKFWRKN